VCYSIEGHRVLVAQLVRAHGSYPWCRRFKSSRRYHFLNLNIGSDRLRFDQNPKTAANKEARGVMSRPAKVFWGMFSVLFGLFWIDNLAHIWLSAVRTSNRDHPDALLWTFPWCLPGVCLIAWGVILLLRSARKRQPPSRSPG
jgi:hypothetical protein